MDLATTDISALFDAQEDLSKLKLEELQTMAKDAGVDKNKVKGAMKADDPEAALIALLQGPKIVSLENAFAAGETAAAEKAVVAAMDELLEARRAVEMNPDDEALALEVTLILQFVWGPSLKAMKIIVLLSASDELSELLQSPL